MQSSIVLIVSLTGLYQRADTLGTQHLADHTPVFEDTDRLQVRPESPTGRLLGPWTVATERRRFSTMCTLRHNATSL